MQPSAPGSARRTICATVSFVARSIHVRLTEKGSSLRDRLHAMHQRHVEMLNQTAITNEDLSAATVTLRRLERFWIRAGDLVQRPGQYAA